MKLAAPLFTAFTGLSLLIGCSDDGTSTGGTTGSTSGSGGTASSTTSASSASGTTATTGAVTSSATSGSTGTGTGAFTLTSTGFVDGSAIPTTYTCPPAGMNMSPDLTWTGSPAGAQSYAIILTDMTNNLIHWAIFDIPSTTTSVPQHISQVKNPPTPAGAKQVKSYDNSTFGYLGPCPPNMHTYRFVVHALDVAALPAVTTDSTRAEVEAAVTAHDLGSAALTGTFTP